MESALYLLVLILCLFVAFMDIVFLSTLVLLPFTKKVRARFLFAKNKKDSYRKFACYEYEGRRYHNLYPAQNDPKGRIYKADSDVEVRILSKFSLALDKLTLITMAIGTVSSAVLSVVMYFLFRFVDTFT